MTIIVVRDRVLAADSGLWEGESIISKTHQKVFRCKWGVMGIFNYPGYMPAAIKAMNEAETMPDRLDLGHDTDIIFLGNDGIIRHYKENYMMEEILPFWAVGPSSPVAYGALHAGADAVTACQIAIEVGPWAAGEVQSMGIPLSSGFATREDIEFGEQIASGEIRPEDTYDEADETPLWKRMRGL